MTPSEFKDQWPSEDYHLQIFSQKDLQIFGFNEETTLFLSTAGLPEEAAPFLNFVQGVSLPSGNMAKITEIYPHLGETYKNCIYIGSDGNGSPIVLTQVTMIAYYF